MQQLTPDRHEQSGWSKWVPQLRETAPVIVPELVSSRGEEIVGGEVSVIGVQERIHLLLPFLRIQIAATIVQDIAQIRGRAAVQLLGRPTLCRFVLELVRQHLEHEAKVTSCQLLEARAGVCVRRRVRVEFLGPSHEIRAIHERRWTSKPKRLVAIQKGFASHLNARNHRPGIIESLPAYLSATQLV